MDQGICQQRSLRLDEVILSEPSKNRGLLGENAFLKKYGFGTAHSYFLVHDGERFDSKAIVGVAAGFVPGSNGPLTSYDLYGGVSIKKLLEALGFEVSVKNIGSIALPPNSADSQPFDPNNLTDARKIVRRTIVQRRGQAAFREKADESI